MQDLQTLAPQVERIAKEAGAILLDYFDNLDQIDYKGHGNPVTEADRASERFVADALADLTPDVPFFGEEFGMQGAGMNAATDACWVVDPLDGTANYSVGLPIFAVAIALMRDAKPVLGVIYDPTRDDLFRGVEGDACLKNGKPCATSDRDPSDGIASIAVSADIISRRPDFLSEVPKGRSLGSAALQLAYVAAGVLDVAMDTYTKLWDVAAGALLVDLAGGTTTDWRGNPVFPLADIGPFEGDPVRFLASNGVNHDAAVRWTAPAVGI